MAVQSQRSKCFGCTLPASKCQIHRSIDRGPRGHMSQHNRHQLYDRPKTLKDGRKPPSRSSSTLQFFNRDWKGMASQPEECDAIEHWLYICAAHRRSKKCPKPTPLSSYSSSSRQLVKMFASHSSAESTGNPCMYTTTA